MENALLTVASLTAIIILGVIMPRVIEVPQAFIDILSKIVFNITVPCAIFYAFVTSEFNPSLILLVAVGFICTFIPWFAAMLITWRENNDRRVFMMCNISGYNIGNFVLPFALAIFPQHTIVAICLFDAGNSLMINGGIYPFTSALVEKGTSLAGRIVLALKRLIKSVPFDLYALLVILAVAGIQIPEQAATFIEPVAHANAFLAMLLLGLMVNFSIDHGKIGQLVRITVCRFALSAILCVVVFLLIPFDFETRLVVAAMLWAPAAGLGPVFTMWLKGDAGLAGLSNVITVVAGVAAMTVLAIILSSGLVL